MRIAVGDGRGGDRDQIQIVVGAESARVARRVPGALKAVREMAVLSGEFAVVGGGGGAQMGSVART